MDSLEREGVHGTDGDHPKGLESSEVATPPSERDIHWKSSCLDSYRFATGVGFRTSTNIVRLYQNQNPG